jgi:membrane carboxypeptidase/penicillin-binding protein
MKIFVYTAAIEAGFTPDTVVPDTPVSYTLGPGDVFTPKNSDGGFMGAIPLRTALAQSRNVVAVKLLTMVGPERVIEYAYRMGIKEKLEPVLSLALGACVVTPLEMASAVSVLANGGIRIEPTAIKMIRDSEGNIVEDHTYPRQEEVLSESTAYTMCEMLRGCVEHGTGTAAAIPGRQVAGKTGTTNDHRDAWFVGFTPQYSTAVWVGNDDYSRMWGAFGGTCAAPIWHDFMVYAHRNLPALAFGTTKGGMVSVLMCSESKKRAGARCPTTYKEFYRPGQVPMAFCDKHGRSPVPVVAGTSSHRSKPSTGSKPPEDRPEEVPEEAPAEIPTPVWMTRPVEVEVQPPGGGAPPASDGPGEPAEVAPVEPVEAAPVEIPQATPEEEPGGPPAQEAPGI